MQDDSCSLLGFLSLFALGISFKKLIAGKNGDNKDNMKDISNNETMKRIKNGKFSKKGSLVHTKTTDMIKNGGHRTR